ncbi:MAG: hypothetical protein HKN62_12095 [Phycisphaerales bacterium]|nr:hypothetical protein [Phycisphaerales bacterium]
MKDRLVRTWRAIILGGHKSWVLFENGTCVIIEALEGDLEDQAVHLMKQWGPVHGGSAAGDFSTVTLKTGDGWVVTSHHRDILTLVLPDELDDDPGELAIGLHGRSKRNQDAATLTVIHVEDRRDAETE